MQLHRRGRRRSSSSRDRRDSRRLLILASSIVFVDTLFFAAVVPLLPALSSEFELSKAEAGVLTASYAAGTAVAALPGGWIAASLGPKRAVLIGLGLMSAAGFAFALGESSPLLVVARFVQGIGGACSWAGALYWMLSTADRTRRGELIGTAMGAGISGLLFGPVVGALADSIGRGPVFGAIAISGLGFILVASATGSDLPEFKPTMEMCVKACRSPGVRLGIWLVLLVGMVFGAIEVLIPLSMSRLGAQAAAIAGAFLVASALQAIVAPIAGRVSDKRGRHSPVLLGLVISSALVALLDEPQTIIGLAALTIIVTPALGIIWSPAMAMVTDGAESARIDLGLAFGFINLGWGLGHALGAVVGGSLGGALGDRFVYVALAIMCALTIAKMLLRNDVRRPVLSQS